LHQLDRQQCQAGLPELSPTVLCHALAKDRGSGQNNLQADFPADEISSLANHIGGLPRLSNVVGAGLG
jgi:hypothetical protein